MVKTEEILIKGHKNKNFCDIFIYTPENIEEAALGNLYMVAELATEKESSQLVNLLNSMIKREYYSLSHRGPLESLEASLKKANTALNELANQGNLEWLGQLHFICAALNKEQELFLTQTGAAQVHLWREGKLSSITRKILPLPEKPHPAKTFQSVISGKIGLTDKLILSTPALFNFLSPPGFKQLFNLPNIKHVSDQINKLLREHKKPPPLGTLLLEIEEEPLSESLTAKPMCRTTPPIRLDEIIY